MTAPAGAPPARRSATRILARGVAVPVLAGAACVLGFAPFYLWPLPILALAVLFRVWAGSGSALQAALSGFAFGLGLFAAGVSWVFVSLHFHGAMPVVLAALATFLLCAYLALFPALAGWVARRLAPALGWRLWAAMPAAFTLAEWTRGWLFTGFPWLSFGTSQAPSGPLAGFAPLAGTPGVTLAAAAAASLLAALVTSTPWSRPRYAALAGLAALFAAGGFLRLAEWSRPAGEPVSVALLQGNIPQHLKWRDEWRAKTLVLYRRMVLDSPARVVVLPETALPAFLDRLPPDYLEELRRHAAEAGKEILLGAVERQAAGEGTRYYNSVVTLGPGRTQAYRKRHLVPFGEFIPPGFGWILAILQIPLTDFARGERAQAPIVAAGLSLGVAICYEDMFGEEVIDHLPAAEALLNVSNDAWFGETLAADQHLQASQMRAIETRRWVLRSTNTGVTAAIDERGRVVARLPQFTTGSIVERVVPRAGATPYARWGNAPALAIAAGLLAATALRRRRA